MQRGKHLLTKLSKMKKISVIGDRTTGQKTVK